MQLKLWNYYEYATYCAYEINKNNKGIIIKKI